METITLLNQTENPVYTLNNDVYYATEHKIMKNIPSLLRCYRATINGRSELIFITGNIKLLTSSLSEIKDFMPIAVKICEAVREIKTNGFLSLLHLDIERTFISGQSIYLTYLPIVSDCTFSNCSEKKVLEFIYDCAKKTGAHLENVSSIDEFLRLTPTSSKYLVLYNPDKNHKIVVDKPRFTIGKKDTVDGLISYSKYVGRVHCKINMENDKFYIIDNDSTNGTYLNGKLVKDKTLLKHGDILSVADVKLEVITQCEE